MVTKKLGGKGFCELLFLVFEKEGFEIGNSSDFMTAGKGGGGFDGKLVHALALGLFTENVVPPQTIAAEAFERNSPGIDAAMTVVA